MTDWLTLYEGDGVRLDLADGVAKIVLHRAPLNEIGTEVLSGLEQALDRIAPATEGVAWRERARALRAGARIAKNAVGTGKLSHTELLDRLRQWRPGATEPAIAEPRALIITSENPRGFSAGADLRRLYHEAVKIDAGTRRDLVAVFLDRIHRVNNRIDTLPIPTIAVVGGICFGGGFELALTCDIRIAERNARFSFPELRLGLIPGFGGIPRLRRDLPNGFVRDVILSGRSVNAKRALAAGLVQQVVPRGEGNAVAMDLAQQMIQHDADTIAVGKRFAKPIPYAELEQEKALFLELLDRPVVINALRKFVESTDALPYLS